jgi:(p)ppGpp synthase/HD superfamily hydrolase
MLETIRQKLNGEIAKFEPEHKSILDQALLLAERIHEGQYRRPKTANPNHRDPYIIHPMRVALILCEEVDMRSTEVIAAAILHDVIEDSDGAVEEGDIAREFGPEVAHIVALLSKPPESPDVSRHEQLETYHRNIASGSISVRMVKLADRLDNIREAFLTDDRKFQVKYLQETREIFLPLAASTNPFFYNALSELCDRLEQQISS